MLLAPIPHDEPERLADLYALAMLETPGEERFDRITRVAARVFAVPIALVSLVDLDRQWFKSCLGLTVSETPRSLSFCSHAITRDEPLIVPNALADPRFATNPLVTGEPHIRFYAGYPLKGPKGYRVGTLCIIDREPRTLSAPDMHILRDLAAWAEQELNGITLERKLVHMEVAEAIQRALLPSMEVRIPALEVAAAYWASNEVGGDYYDLLSVGSDRLITIMADVSGHSYAAGLLMTSARSVMRLLAQHTSSPGEILRQLTQALYHDLERTGLLISAVVILTDIAHQRLVCANAGHVPPLLYRVSSGTVAMLGATGPLVGLEPEAAFAETEMALSPGDVLVLYTDGVTEARDQSQQFFGEARLQQLLGLHQAASADAMVEAIIAAVRRHTCERITDDVTVFVQKLRPQWCKDGSH